MNSPVSSFSVAALIAIIQLSAAVLAAELSSTQLLRMSTILGRLSSLSGGLVVGCVCGISVVLIEFDYLLLRLWLLVMLAWLSSLSSLTTGLALVPGVDIVLASGSPRRSEILKDIGCLGRQVRVVPSTFEENIDKNKFTSAGDYAVATARGKAEQVRNLLISTSSGAQEQREQQENKRHLIIGCDTVVVSPTGKVLEKPVDENDAVAMLQSLSNKWHSVFSGVTLYSSKFGVNPVASFFEETKVKFAELRKDDISTYVKTREPMDKAGAYGIQGMAGYFVERIEGDYYNVVGFPLHSFSREVVKLLDNGEL